LAALLAAVCSPQPDVEAWRAFETIANHECGSDVDAFLAASLSESLKRQPAGRRDASAAAVALLIAEHSICPGLLLRRLAASREAIARRLAWGVAERAPSLLTREVLDTLTEGLRTHHALDRLRRLEQRTGPHPVLREFQADLEQRVRMRCSRCAVELRRRDMIQHLWSAHGLVLDGHRAREPWEVIDDWITCYQRGLEPALLDRCRLLGQRADQEQGLTRVYRHFLARGLHDREARANLLAEAEEQHASLCPFCYAVIPMPEQAPPAAVSLSHGRLSAGGYRVEIHEKGIFPYLTIESPGGPPSRLPLPGPRLTRQGAMLFLVGPLIIAALLMALLPLNLGISPVITVVTFLLPAVMFALWIRLAGQSKVSATERALNFAWTALAPTLHADSFSVADSAFLAGLALESLGRSRSQARARALERGLRFTEDAVGARPGALHQLAALHALTLADQVEAGGDPVALAVAQVGRCFRGRLPLLFGDKLLSLWRKEWRTRANLARLRVQLLDRAFEAGFEVRNLLSAAQTAPVLGKMLGADDPGGLARLRLLWSLRPRRPWDHCGDADTVFGLAETAANSALLSQYPDLLLYQSDFSASSGRRRAGKQLEIVVCGQGIFVEGKLFAAPFRTIEWQSRRNGDEAQRVLLLDGVRIVVPGDPDEAAAQVERWFRYYFNDFVAQVAEVYRWRSPHATAIMRAWGTVPCPDCKRPLVARPGEVGIAVEE
jgi:hypothetical protein